MRETLIHVQPDIIAKPMEFRPERLIENPTSRQPEVEICRESPACRHEIYRNAVSSKDVKDKHKRVRGSRNIIESWRCCKNTKSESLLVSYESCVFTHLHNAGEQSLLGSTFGG